MNTSPRALDVTANPELHTFTVLDVYTGRSYECKLARETKCYYVMWVKCLSGGRFLERRFHKATMTHVDLNLYIELTADVEAAAAAKAETITQLKDDSNAEIVRTTQNYYIVNVALPGREPFQTAFKIGTMQNGALTLTITHGVPHVTDARAEAVAATADTVNEDLEQLITPESIAAVEAVQADTTPSENAQALAAPTRRNPDGHPCFCHNCEQYHPFDEMIENTPTGLTVCIDCDDELDTAARERLATIKNVATLNYICGHLPGFNFTPTLRHLPRMLIAFTPNTGQPDSPNEMIRRLGYSVVVAARGSHVRVVYDDSGAYVVHGGFNEIEPALTAIINGD